MAHFETFKMRKHASEFMLGVPTHFGATLRPPRSTSAMAMGYAMVTLAKTMTKVMRILTPVPTAVPIVKQCAKSCSLTFNHKREISN